MSMPLNDHREEDQTEANGILNPVRRGLKSGEEGELPQYFLAWKKLVTSGAKL